MTSTLDSSLLFMREDGEKYFNHDTNLEYFLALKFKDTPPLNTLQKLRPISTNALLFYAEIIDDASDLINSLWCEFNDVKEKVPVKIRSFRNITLTEEQSKYRNIIDQFPEAVDAIFLAAECYKVANRTNTTQKSKREIAREVYKLWSTSTFEFKDYDDTITYKRLHGRLIGLGHGDFEFVSEMMECGLDGYSILDIGLEFEEALRYAAQKLHENKILATSIYSYIEKILSSPCETLIDVAIDMVNGKYGSGFSQEVGSYGAAYNWYSYYLQAFQKLATMEDPRVISIIRDRLTNGFGYKKRDEFAFNLSCVSNMSKSVSELVESFMVDSDENFVKALKGERLNIFW
jgi:hypothetical protein